jgi:hypothetical protein
MTTIDPYDEWITQQELKDRYDLPERISTMSKFSELDIARQNAAIRPRHIEGSLILSSKMSGEVYIRVFLVTPDGGAFMTLDDDAKFDFPLADPFPDRQALVFLEAVCESQCRHPD